MKFIADKMLGRLAKWLRILGWDTCYFQGKNSSELILQAIREDRLILTRDTHLSKKRVIKLIFIQSDFIFEQLEQIIKTLKLPIKEENLFTRCSICNKPIEEIPKEKIRGRIAPYIFDTKNIFAYCQNCDKIYWRGTHWDNILAALKKCKTK